MAAPRLCWMGSRALGLAARRAWSRSRFSRCARSGISVCFPSSGPQQPFWVFSACLHSRESALDHILGTGKEEGGTSFLVGQHPPPACAFEDEHENLLAHQPDQPENSKALRIAIIGAPNAGKSTLSNQLLGRKVLPVSKKVHTTRCSAQGIITAEDTQLIILDTPGLTTSAKGKRHNLGRKMLSDPLKSCSSADLVLVLVDVSDRYTRDRLQPQVLHCLTKFPQVPSVLVLNKVDLVKKKGLLLDLVVELTEGTFSGKKLPVKSKYRLDSEQQLPGRAQTALASESSTAAPAGRQVEKAVEDVGSALEKEAGQFRKGWPFFQDIFMLTALNKEEVETLKTYLLKQARPGSWAFHSEVLTNQSPQEICDNLVREKVMEYLPEEVPYAVTQRTVLWEEGPGGELIILQNLEVQKESHLKMLIGYRGEVISRIATEAGQDLMDAFLCEVRLKLCVQLKK